MIKYISGNKSNSFGNATKKRRITPYKWIRDLTSSIDIGKMKVKKNGEKYTPHLNTKKDVLAAYNRGHWWRIDQMVNLDFDDHFTSLETFYFAAGSGDRVLILIDVDCKRYGTLAGASAYCKFLSKTLFPNMYFEPSTNGNGAHGYVIVETNGLKGRFFNELLLHHLAPYLNQLAAGFDIEFVEVKGTMPDFGWGEAKGELRTYRCGCLGKLPRDVTRFDEWQATAVINAEDLRRLPVDKPEAEMSVGKKEKRKLRTSFRDTPAKSCSGTLFDEEEVALIQSHYRHVAELLMGGRPLKTSGKHVVRTEDMAILLCIGKFCTENMNADGTLPFDRIKGLWGALKAAGDVERPFDNKRYGVIRDHLSQLGLLDWEDNTFVIGGDGKDGRACKWRFSTELMDLLASGEEEERRTSFRSTPALETTNQSPELKNHTVEPTKGGRGSILEGHSFSKTDDYLRPEQVLTGFDYLLADEMVDQIIAGWGETALAA